MIYLFVYLAFILIVTQALLGFELLQPLRGVLLAATVNHHKQSGEQRRGGEQETATEREAGVSYPFSFPPGGGSTRAARGRNGDLGERDCWEGEGSGPSVWLSESALFLSWAWRQGENIQTLWQKERKKRDATSTKSIHMHNRNLQFISWGFICTE